MTDELRLQGLRGWLILVGIIVVMSPLRSIVEMAWTYPSMFRNDEFVGLITAGSEAYQPNLRTVFLSEVILNLLLLAFSVWVAFLFFSKHYRFPGMFLAMIGFSLLSHILVTWGYAVAAPWIPVFDPETLRAFFRLIVACLIWTPYMLVSKRVKLTFVRHRKADYQLVTG